MEDITVVKAEVERIRHHMDLQKKATEENTKLLVDIKNILVGNDLKEEGLVSDFKEMKAEVDELREFKGEVSVYLKQAKFVIGGIVIAVIGLFIKLFAKT